MMGSLSVRENLQFSAALRLPSHMSREQRRERVEKVISELGLESCAKTKVIININLSGTFHVCEVVTWLFRLGLSSSEECQEERERGLALEWS